MRTSAPFLLIVFFGCGRVGSIPDAGSEEVAPTSAGSAKCYWSQSTTRRNLPPICIDDITNLTDATTVVNDTELPVRMTDVQKSCTCASPSIEHSDLAPGQETKLTTTVNLPRRAGPWSYSLKLQGADGTIREILTSAFLYKTLDSDCESITRSEIRPDETETVTIHVVVRQPQDDFTSRPKCKAAQGRMSIRVSEPLTKVREHFIERTYEVSLLLTPAPANANTQDSLTVTIGEERGLKLLSIPVSWRARSVVRSVPDRCFLVVRPESTTQVSQTLLISCAEGEFKPSLAPSSNLPRGVTVLFRPTTNPLTYKAEITAAPDLLASNSQRLDILIATGRVDEPICRLPLTIFRD
jgi:hypothetical protein